MSDFIYILILSVTMWFHQVATTYEVENKRNLVALQETNSFLWLEGENTTARLKACEKKKGKR